MFADIRGELKAISRRAHPRHTTPHEQVSGERALRARREWRLFHMSSAQDRPERLPALVAQYLFIGRLTYLRLPLDFTRLNQFPEWFTVAADEQIEIREIGVKQPALHTGREAWEGTPITLSARRLMRLTLTRAAGG